MELMGIGEMSSYPYIVSFGRNNYCSEGMHLWEIKLYDDPGSTQPKPQSLAGHPRNANVIESGTRSAVSQAPASVPGMHLHLTSQTEAVLLVRLN